MQHRSCLRDAPIVQGGIHSLTLESSAIYGKKSTSAGWEDKSQEPLWKSEEERPLLVRRKTRVFFYL
jgi:hypothetical protein